MNYEILTLLAILAFAAPQGGSKYRVVNSWKTVDFDYPNKEARSRAIRSRDFVPGNSVPIDVDIWHQAGETKTFVTIPRFKEGIPASLAIVKPAHGSNGPPLLRPYPDWQTHTYGNCQGLTSVFRTQIDRCGRLWAIDSGMAELNIFPRRRLCPPKLAVLDLSNDRLVKTIYIPTKLLTDMSILTTIALDTRGSCDDTFVYVSDTGAYQLLVVDVRRGAVWRVQSNSMYPDPVRGLFRTNGVEFDLMDGVLGLALPKSDNPDLFYHAFASLRESFVPTSVLRNESLFETGFNMAPRRFRTTDEVRPSQAAAQAFDASGILYFAPVSDNTIFCWNSQLPYTKSNLVRLVTDDRDLQFATGLKVHKNNKGEEELYMLTSRLHLSMVNQLRSDEVNFRIIKAPIRQLTQGTACFNPRGPGGSISFPGSTPTKPTSYGYFSG